MQEGDEPEAAVTRKGGDESMNDVAKGLRTWPRLYLASLSKSHASSGFYKHKTAKIAYSKVNTVLTVDFT